MHDSPDAKRRSLLGRFLAGGAALAAGAAGAAAPVREERVAYHLDDLERVATALRQAINHLDASPKAKLVIVALGGAIDFLVEGTPAPHGNSWAAMVETLQFRGTQFRACNNTLKARNIDRSRLPSDVAVIESGIAELARLQIREGFAYIKP